MQLDDLLQVGEDVFDICGGQNGLSGHPLVKHVIQDLQRAQVSALRVEQLCTAWQELRIRKRKS